jgi:acyl-ACP thioesterase
MTEAPSPSPSPSPSLSHQAAYRARFDECGPDGLLRSSGFMRWAQDTAWLHSEALGFTREWYAERGLWWLVRCAELNVVGAVRMGETASVATTIVGYRKVWARRRTEVTGADGARVAVALTDWVITDARGAPTRVPAEFASRFGGSVQTFTPGRVVLPPTPAAAAPRQVAVRPSDIDPMAHMNNAAYIDVLEEGLDAAAAARVPRRYRLEYVAAAGPGDVLTAATWPQGDGFAFRLTSGADIEILRATLDAETAHDEFRELVAARRGWRAPGKDAGVG